MANGLFLTENRREVLDGTTDWTEDSVTVEKSRIRSKADIALNELTEIAQSAEIENHSVFDPEQIGMLLYWILNDPATMVSGGLITPHEDVPDEAGPTYTDRHQQYRQNVHSEAAQELLRMDYPERGR